MLLVLFIVFVAGCGKTAKTNAALPEVRNSGTAIQWRYPAEEEWRDLVALTELRGASGENGKDGADGKNGVDGRNGTNGENGKDGINGIDGKNGADGKNGLDGKDGADGKNGIDGKDGINGKDGVDGKNGLDGKDGINGQDGRDGADGQNGSDGKDGKTPFIGENGNWWFGEIDTGIKAAGIDGIDGEKGDKGDKGDPGEKGDKGDKGDAGQNGSCSGYFYAETRIPRVFLNNGNAALSVYEKVNSGDLISTYLDKITLKKGHVYSVTISGSLQVVSNESNNSGNYSIQMTDGYDDDLCREVTRIKRDGKKIAQTNDQHSFNFTRIYDASDEDITLYFMFEQSAYNTRLESFKGTITITALD